MTATIDRKKIRVSKSTSSNFYLITDTNKTRRCTAEVIPGLVGTWSVRIDRFGKPWKYAANVALATPEAAYEYTTEFGELVANDD